MSYFEAEDKVPVQQTSIGIPSENGLTYNSTQTIEISVPATTKFFNPKESVLQFNVNIAPPTSASGVTRLQLDAEIGAQILIKDIRIWDGTHNTLLEEITDYNTMVAMKYDYETNQSLRNKRALTEGATIQTPSGRGTRGSTETQLNSFTENPYFTPRTADPDVTAWTSANWLSAKVDLPLHTGIFQNDRIFPLLLTNGLHISITLETDNRVFRNMDGVSSNRRATLNPIFHSINGCATTGAIAGGDTTSTWFFAVENNQQATNKNCPFVVGEPFNLVKLSDGSSATWTATTANPIISRIEYDTSTTPNLIKVTSTLTKELDTGGPITTNGAWSYYSTAVSDSTTFNPTYTVSNVELILAQVSVDPRYEAGMVSRMKEGGIITYDFLSATNYRHSQLVSDRVANIRLPLNNARAKSIICVPTDASVYTSKQNIDSEDTYLLTTANNRDWQNYSCRSGMVGLSDNITNYNFLYDGRLQPSRLVSLSKTSSKVSISQQALIENDKALTSAGINTHSMRNFSNNFVIGRSLSLGSGVYDARNKDFNLQVNYQETNGPTKAHLWKCYCFHIRRLNIRGDSISVEV